MNPNPTGPGGTPDKKEFLSQQFAESQRRIEALRAAIEEKKHGHEIQKIQEAKRAEEYVLQEQEQQEAQERLVKHWKKQKKQREEDVAEMKKQQEEHLKYLEAKKAKTEREQAKRAGYLKELAAQNKFMMRAEKRKTEAQKYVETGKREAEGLTFRRKQEIDMETARAKRDLAADTRNVRAHIDLEEKKAKQELDERATKEVAKLNTTERTQLLTYGQEVQRKRAEANRIGNAGERLRMLGDVEREEVWKLQTIKADFDRKKSEIIARTQKEKFQIEAKCRKLRDEASMAEREGVAHLEKQAYQRKHDAEREETKRKEHIKQNQDRILKGEKPQ
ncbi:MAG: hypothetical protein PHH13_03560 [Candidatus Peribacteraceae bacterium]|nr:hypothetical protein [Candidatus Peribacteraceae bacterium]